MVESYVQVPADSTGKKLHTIQHVVGANTVEDEVIEIADSSQNIINPAKEDGNLATIAGDTTSLDGKVTACNTGAVTVSAALPAGTNLLGKVGIDQTTPGTTNRVDIGAALPTGANAIGKLAANTGVDIGDVDVTSIVPGTAATNLGKAEDAGHTSSDVGVMALGVRNDTPTARSGADGDYTPLAVDKYGRVITTPFADFTDLKTVAINCAVSGNNTIVAAQGAGTYIAVWSWFIVSDGTVDFRWEDGAGGTALSGQVPLQAREGVSHNGGARPCMVCSANTLLNLELSAAINVHGSVAYTVEA